MTIEVAGVAATQAQVNTINSDLGQPFAWAHVNDGSDQYAGIQAALDTGAADVFIPPGVRKITHSLELMRGQTLRGVEMGNIISSTPSNTTAKQSTIQYRPTGADVVAIRNKTADIETGGGASIKNICLDLDDDTHTGVQFSVSYGNVIDGLMLLGTMDIGILMNDSYVWDINRVVMNGAIVKRFCIYSGAFNACRISRFHTGSTYPSDAAVCLYGIGIQGTGSALSIDDCVFQGQTIGVALGGSGTRNVNINNMYCEGSVCCIRTGDIGSGTGPNAVTVNGGVFRAPYNTHSQYASRGTMIYLRAGSLFSIKGARFEDQLAPATNTGPWGIVGGLGLASIKIESCGSYLSNYMTDLFMREESGVNANIAIIGDRYPGDDTYFSSCVILKKGGAYNSTCYALGIDTSGAVITSAWQPAIIPAAVDALLQTDLPAPATLLK